MTYPCVHCGHAFQRRSALRRHTIGIHEKRKDFQCQFCSQCFTRSDSLQCHISLYHKSLPLLYNKSTRPPSLLLTEATSARSSTVLSSSQSPTLNVSNSQLDSIQNQPLFSTPSCQFDKPFQDNIGGSGNAVLQPDQCNPIIYKSSIQNTSMNIFRGTRETKSSRCFTDTFTLDRGLIDMVSDTSKRNDSTDSQRNPLGMVADDQIDLKLSPRMPFITSNSIKADSTSIYDTNPTYQNKINQLMPILNKDEKGGKAIKRKLSRSEVKEKYIYSFDHHLPFIYLPTLDIEREDDDDHFTSNLYAGIYAIV